MLDVITFMQSFMYTDIHLRITDKLPNCLPDASTTSGSLRLRDDVRWFFLQIDKIGFIRWWREVISAVVFKDLQINGQNDTIRLKDNSNA